MLASKFTLALVLALWLSKPCLAQEDQNFSVSLPEPGGANATADLSGRYRLAQSPAAVRQTGYQDQVTDDQTRRYPRNDYLQEQDRRSSFEGSIGQVGSSSGSFQDRLSVGEIVGSKLLLNNCTVLFIDDVKLPARESGQIIRIDVKEGDQVQANQLLAQIDDSLFKLQEQRARISYENANDKATDPTTIKAHEKEVELQRAKLTRAQSLFKKGSMNTAEYEIAQFEFELAILKVKAAENARKTAEGEARIELAQIDEVKQRILRHQLFIDFDGYVIELLKQKSEWVNAGDPVMRVARMDRLTVQALVSTNVANPHQIRSQQNVLVTLQMAGGKTEQFSGKISSVSLVRETGTLIKIKAEVENRKFDAHNWLLQPLSVVEMTVDLN